MPIEHCYIFRCGRQECDHSNLVLAAPQRRAETVARQYLWSKSNGLWYCPSHAPGGMWSPARAAKPGESLTDQR